MSVESHDYKMPQPEKWLSKHEPWATLGIVLGVVIVAIIAGWLT